MDWWLLSFFLGAILSLFLPIVPALFYLSLFFITVIGHYYYKPLKNSSGLVLGLLWMMLHAYLYQNSWQLNDVEPNTLAGKAVVLQGQVITLPVTAPGGYDKDKVQDISRFNFRVDKLNQKPLNRSFIVRLRWDNAGVKPALGQEYQLTVRMKPAHGLANPGGFSYQTWLRYKHIAATGYVLDKPLPLLLGGDLPVRQRLFSRYLQLLPPAEVAALLPALSFGERSGISQEMWQVLQSSGTSHLMAISGLHLGLVATGSFFVILWLLRRFPLAAVLPQGLTLALMQINLNKLAIAASLAITLFYAYLAGFSLPTQRALVMLLLYWGIRLAGGKFTLRRWLLIALFLLTLIDPFSLFSASFWLSVYAICCIFLLLWRFGTVFDQGSKAKKVVKSLLIIQLGLTLFMMPVTALFFHQFSLASFLANIVAVPYMSLISIPLCLLSALSLFISDSLASLFMNMALQSLELLWTYLVFLSGQSWALISLSLNQVYYLCVFLLLVMAWCFLSPNLLHPWHLLSGKDDNRWQRGRAGLLQKPAMSVLLVAGIAITGFSLSGLRAPLISDPPAAESVNQPLNSPWQVHVLDVGQGLAVIIRRGSRAILYDTGAAYPGGFNLAQSVILPFLQYQGLAGLDKVIISHSDNDHAGGLPVLKAEVVIDEVMANDPVLEGRGICLLGHDFNWQGLHFSMLWPPDIKGEANDDSCVIKISDGVHSLLLTGDISKKVESKLLSKLSHSQVLIAPHHGSKSSSSQAFINRVSPRYVIFSAGYLNRWHMPSAEVLARYQKAQPEIFTTAESGMIQLEFSQSGIHIKQYRQDLWPFWFAN
ncbi:DNA internalization-related competence protein ComEC/Rec2 [Thalassomonas actiniarum]|uniref:DNA internalization-related competence protein ComEC/Rec2 n=1 Tax=Thalassomonas actiniarum TaxID=485447 RepID=A0AAF0C2Y3_9GAMM|nr:DNA internalization-related competence protein ComEC/Rec2 [Thalassomonas actiniarum]WDE00642.1 DNA internalization-related competence protein ComEC/Rec2 [Thalassomonas actiniarum]